ncbi:MAG: hypothetical protein L6E13_01610 [Firmicutes bacterium]|nr:hypothetical protein [Bacillota bacterium]
MLAALILLLGTGLLFYGLWEIRRYLDALARTEPELRAAEARLEELLADLDEAMAAVDRRTGELEALLARADACLAALRQASVGPEPSLPLKGTGAPGTGALEAPAPAEPSPPAGRAGAFGQADPWPTLGSVETPARAESEGSAADPGADPGAHTQAETEWRAADPGGPWTLADRVGELADQGLGEEAIAARLGLTRGVVRLALGLRGLRGDRRAPGGTASRGPEAGPPQDRDRSPDLRAAGEGDGR